ncbi:MAG: lysine--tRNA ligase, partial [Deltaproteobacteria bacterium]
MSEQGSSLRDVRLKKIEEFREKGISPFRNDFRISHQLRQIVETYGNWESQELEGLGETFSLAGRMVALRSFGKAAFIKLMDMTGRLQVYVRKDKVGEEAFEVFKKLDVGDIIGVSGTLFRTRTNELTLLAESVVLLTKSIRPLPEKWHGLTDIETRYRQRYVDLIVNQDVREIFFKRTQIIRLIREFFMDRGFLEVETPMMQPIYGGAAARPFVTHHNALDMKLYLRIAPELYLKRLVVGGFDRVFELNRNFRNEGISTQHNPEFTMLEFYLAYATYEDLLDLTETFINHIVDTLSGRKPLPFGEYTIDYSPPWKRMTVREAVLTYAPGITEEILGDVAKMEAYIKDKTDVEVVGVHSPGKLLMTIFEETVEDKLIQPTFITQYPVEVSPLSRRNDADPSFTDRFELFIAGREIANGFSELNDPIDQKQRFLDQLKERETGDEEAHQMDEDYIRALEYGLPPTAGEGIG